jgi:hypothetical protein
MMRRAQAAVSLVCIAVNSVVSRVPDRIAGNPTPSSMRECVLNLATITDIPRVIVEGRTGEQLSRVCVTLAHLHCAGLSPLGRRPLVALVYPTPEQAAATLIAVHCCTWNVKAQASSNVLPALIMLKSEACVLLQAVYRGHLSRRAVDPLKNVIVNNHGKFSVARALLSNVLTIAFALCRNERVPSPHYNLALRWAHLLRLGCVWLAQADVNPPIFFPNDARCNTFPARYGGSKNFKIPDAEDAEASAKTGGCARRLEQGSATRSKAPDSRPVALNRNEQAKMNQIIAKKMRSDIELALEIADVNSMRNVDAAVLR